MAKGKSLKKFEFSQIGKIMEQASEGKHVIINNSQKREFIPTSIYILNALLSGSLLHGGILTNRITIMAGEEATGKSYLCYHIGREAQKKGYKIIYIDTEGSIELDDFASHGIKSDPDNLMLVDCSVVEDLTHILANLLSKLQEAKDQGFELEKIIIFIDSLGQLSSRKEKLVAIEGKDTLDMTRAKAIKALFRIVNSDLKHLGIPMVCTNHTYKSQDFIPTDIMGGGKGPYYSASHIVFLSKAKLKTGEEDDLDLGQTGIIVTAKAIKNRLAKPKKVKFHISFDAGTNPFVGLDFFCLPAVYKQVGIAKGKPKITSDGEETFEEGGNRWYVRHLNKHITASELFTAKVFTQEVLEALEPLIYEYFRYKNHEEVESMLKNFEKLIDEAEVKASKMTNSKSMTEITASDFDEQLDSDE
jgi:RecA/RadA recombinase